MNEGSSNDIAFLGYELHFELTAIIHDERGVVVLIVVVVVVVTATSLEVELIHNKYERCHVLKYSQ